MWGRAHVPGQNLGLVAHLGTGFLDWSGGGCSGAVKDSKLGPGTWSKDM